jgi:hypothetical protein
LCLEILLRAGYTPDVKETVAEAEFFLLKNLPMIRLQESDGSWFD